MAQKSTIYKVEIQLSDLTRHLYDSFSTTVALHPSETIERMMTRIVMFSLHAHEQLVFCKGVSTDDEPDLWLKSLSGDTELWIELGQLSEERIRKACSKSKRVIVASFQDNAGDVWWKQHQTKLTRFNHLDVVKIPQQSVEQLAAMCGRTMHFSVTIDESNISISDEKDYVSFEVESLMISGAVVD
jgi:uncharacterized protein YaeQ